MQLAVKYTCTQLKKEKDRRNVVAIVVDVDVSYQKVMEVCFASCRAALLLNSRFFS